MEEELPPRLVTKSLVRLLGMRGEVVKALERLDLNVEKLSYCCICPATQCYLWRNICRFPLLFVFVFFLFSSLFFLRIVKINYAFFKTIKQY